MLRGQAILNPVRSEDGKPPKGELWPMPKDADMQKLFTYYERDAFAGKEKARNGFYQAAKSIYAARSVDAGDSSGILDKDRWDEAIKLATGGIERWNGKSIVMPWGMDTGMFKDELRRHVEDLVRTGRVDFGFRGHFGSNESMEETGHGITIGRLMDLPLESIGDGRYVFRAGDGILVDKAQKPVILDFTRSAPFRASGYDLDQYSKELTAEELQQASQAARLIPKRSKDAATGRDIPKAFISKPPKFEG